MISWHILFWHYFSDIKYTSIIHKHNANSLFRSFNYILKNLLSIKFGTTFSCQMPEYKAPSLYTLIYLSSFYFIYLSSFYLYICINSWLVYYTLYKPAVSGICLNISSISLSLYLLSMFTFLPLDSLFKFIYRSRPAPLAPILLPLFFTY